MLLDTDLPDDPDALRAMVVEQAAERRILKERIVALVTANEDADAEIIRLAERFAALQATLEEQFAESARLTDVIREGFPPLSSRRNSAAVFTRPENVERKRRFLYTLPATCKISDATFHETAN